MNEIGNNELKTYIKEVVKLESSIYQQEQVRENALKQLEQSRPKKRRVVAPMKNSIPKPEKTQQHLRSELAANNKEGNKNVKMCILIGVVASIIGFALMPIVPEASIPLAGIGVFFVVVMGLVKTAAQKSVKEALEKHEKEYAEKMAAYEERTAGYEKEYLEEMEVYRQEDAEARRELAENEKKYAEAQSAVKSLDAPLRECKATLQRLYKMNIIFPKYRNLIAMCSIYEYMLSGRCVALEGAEGAYNLYESELRQNIIIGQLDRVVSQLAVIQQNQYTLYTEIQKTNAILEDVKGELGNIYKMTADIANYSHITAVCSQATVRNTEALKYITLVNG